MASESAHPEPVLRNGRGHNSERPEYSKKKKKKKYLLSAYYMPGPLLDAGCLVELTISIHHP